MIPVSRLVPRSPVPLVETARRDRILKQVISRIGDYNLTYKQAAEAIGSKYGTLRNAIVGDVAPGPVLIEKCETWLASVQQSTK